MAEWLPIRSDLMVKGRHWFDYSAQPYADLEVCLDFSAVLLVKLIAKRGFPSSSLYEGGVLMLAIPWADVESFTLK